jgi:hemoglobin
MRPTLYDHAGGDAGLLRLAQAHHARCLADPELNHPFSHGGHAQHLERLAAYWGEVFGGPATYSQSCGSQTDVLVMHAGNGDMSDLGRRFVECFVAAADDAGLPADAEFRAALRAYMEWAMPAFIGYPDGGEAVPNGLAVPHWGWDGLLSA